MRVKMKGMMRKVRMTEEEKTNKKMKMKTKRLARIYSINALK